MNILLVEDEPPILRDIKAIIESFQEDYQIIASITNGKDAIDYLDVHNKRVDVIITDLHIPAVDGLKLLEYITTHMPHILCIILTGYSKFEYAKKAIQFGVFGYLLKPIDEEELRQQLKRAYSKKCIDSINETMYDSEYSYPSIKQSVNSYYYLASICLGPFPIHATALNSSSYKSWKQVDLESYLHNEDLLKDNYWIINGASPSEKSILFSLPFAENEDNLDFLHHLFVPFLDYPFTITIAICSHCQNIHTVHKSAQKLRVYLSRNLRLEKSQILFYPGKPISDETSDITSYQNYQVRLKQLYQARNITLFKAELNNYLKQMKQMEITQTMMYRLLYHLISACISLDYMAASANNLDVHAAVIDILMLSDTFQALHDNLFSIFLSFFEALAKGTSSLDSRMDTLLKIDAYIKENYMKPINTKEIAQAFGFTPAYLSKIFREYKNLTPAEYIVNLRIKKAKQLFHSDTGCKIKDVANFVGYDDSLYFSKVFKKIIGVSPKQFILNKNTLH